MNADEISAFFEFCDEHGLGRPSLSFMYQRRWIWRPAYSWTNLSIDGRMIFGELSQHMTKDEYTRNLRWLWSHSEGDLEQSDIEIIFTNHNGTTLNITDLLTPQ